MKDRLKIKGFLRGQIVDAKTGKIVGDTGWKENVVTNYGLTALAAFAAGAAGSNKPTYGVLATQTDAMNVAQTALSGTSNSFMAFGATGTSATCTASYTVSFAGANGAISVAAAGLHSSNALGGLWAGQTFAASSMATNQNFNLTYQLRFSTA